MSLLEDQLSTLIGKKIIVTMSDGCKFRGILVNHDSKIIIMDDVYELSEGLQWVRPVVLTTVAKSVLEKKDVVDQSERGFLNKVIINTRHIIRLWPYEPHKIKNKAKV